MGAAPLTAEAPGPGDAGAPRVRVATAGDATAIRLVVTEALLTGGFDAPDPVRDADLADAAYYAERGRALWVAERADGTVVGCAALDRGDGRVALLRRLAGRGLRELTRTAIAAARASGYAGIETVLPLAMAEAREAVAGEGFVPPGRHNDLLLRRSL